MNNTGSKEAVRRYIWRLLEEKNAALPPKPVVGRIPNFKGAGVAAARLAAHQGFKQARVVMVGPDSPQRPVRETVLKQGKLLLAPTPRFKSGFLLLEPGLVPRGRVRWATTIRGMFSLGRPVKLNEIPKVDMVVLGSVAVSRTGIRLGKGGGYGDLEYAVLRELGRIDEGTLVATTIHDLQLVDSLPVEPHDLTIDIIATPTRLIEVHPRPPKPSGVDWSMISEDVLPFLKELRKLVKT